MTIDEAIKVNQSMLDGTYDHRDEDMEDALKLGIEALICVNEIRHFPFPDSVIKLPGES